LNPTNLFDQFSAEGKKEIARQDQWIVEMRGRLAYFRRFICKDQNNQAIPIIIKNRVDFVYLGLLLEGAI